MRGGGAPENNAPAGFVEVPCKVKINQSMLCCESFAFTLAEVLITLGIIGIVAAMTLPTVINKAERFILAQQFKKTYANLQNAINLVQTEHGMPYECYVMGALRYYYSECGDFWPKLLDELRVIKVCNYAEDNCILKYKTKNDVLNAGGSVDNHSCSLTDNLDKFKVFTLNDGAFIIANDGSTGLGYSPWVVIDVNGEKGPNKWGYDVFWTNLYRENEKKNVVLYDEICKMKEKGGMYFSEMILK